MALTPMDIAQKEFSHAMRGYSVEEVDAFLDEVKNEFANLLNAVEESRRAIASCEQKIAHYVEIESTLNSAFVSAQQSADAIKKQAQQDSDELLEKARAEGERIYREADQQRRDMERQAENEKRAHELELARLKDSEERFRKEYAALIAHFTAELQDIPVPTEDDAAESSADPDVEEVVAEEIVIEEAAPVAVGEGQPAPAEYVEPAAPEATAAPASTPAPSPEPAPEPAPKPTTPVAQPAPAAPADTEEPKEEPAPAVSTDVYGEMEDDLDIEEID